MDMSMNTGSPLEMIEEERSTGKITKVVKFERSLSEQDMIKLTMSDSNKEYLEYLRDYYPEIIAGMCGDKPPRRPWLTIFMIAFYLMMLIYLITKNQ